MAEEQMTLQCKIFETTMDTVKNYYFFQIENLLLLGMKILKQQQGCNKETNMPLT